MYDDVLEVMNPCDNILFNLFMGGTLTDYSKFDYVLCLTPDVSSHGRMGQFTCTLPFSDTRIIPSNAFLRDAVELVLDRMNRGTVLVHCSAGLNRSGLIVGLVMIELGWKPKDAIEYMRSVRSCSVLHNEYFERHVLNYIKGSLV